MYCNKRWKHRKEKRKQHFVRKLQRWANEEGISLFTLPVNVAETTDNYELSLFAPELKKEDFKISVTDNNTLHIAIKTKEQEADEDIMWRRKEYQPNGYKRSFELGKSVDAKAVKAQYKKGVLKLSLPKLEEFKTTQNEIVID